MHLAIAMLQGSICISMCQEYCFYCTCFLILNRTHAFPIDIIYLKVAMVSWCANDLLVALQICVCPWTPNKVIVLMREIWRVCVRAQNFLFPWFQRLCKGKSKHWGITEKICIKMSQMINLHTVVSCTQELWPSDHMTWLTGDLGWLTDPWRLRSRETTAKQAISNRNDCSACHFLPGGHMHTAPGRGHDLEVSLYRFIVSLRPCFLHHCIPTEPLIWAFIKWVHRHGVGAPALISHRPSAGSKSSIYLCYEGHVERTMGVALRDALRDNCLTIPRDLW